MSLDASPAATATQQTDPRFPVGEFRKPTPEVPVPHKELAAAIAALAELPEQLRNAVESLDGDQLDTPYRESGWTVRQVVHHLADSHMNVFVRTRLALTEDAPPTISAYNQDAWVRLHDSQAPVEWSLVLVEGLHARWVMLLQSLTPEQWGRRFLHPAYGPQVLDATALLYAWHGRHHVAHITHLRAARGW